jgi:hypothetical protein
MPKKIIVILSVLALGFEVDLLTLGESEIKPWILAAAAGGVLLLTELYQKGFGWLKQSKLFWLGLSFIFFSALGILNSPLRGFSLKQLVVLAAIVVLGVFFEQNWQKYRSLVYWGLLTGMLVNSAFALYQNIALNLGWPNFEIMAARPNGFFPEPDWLGFYLALGLVPFLVWAGRDLRKSRLPETLKNQWIFYPVLVIIVTVLTITVARASWLALIAEMGTILLITLSGKNVILSESEESNSEFGIDSSASPQDDKNKKKNWLIQPIKTAGVFLALIITPLILVSLLHLSRFNIPDRFRSIFFKEHIITEAYNPTTGEKQKINLEEIDAYRQQGYQIQEEYTGDENVASREEKAASAWDTIKDHPLLGSGLGITLIKTNYQHNANNLFLEWWASAGLGGLLLIIGLIFYLLYRGITIIRSNPQKAALVLAGTLGFIIANLFNASIFLAFAWFYLAWLLSL